MEAPNAAPSPPSATAKAATKEPNSKAAARATVSTDDGDDSDDEQARDLSVEPNEGAHDTIVVLAHVRDEIVPVHCGFGTQQVLWLAHVAIARFGEERDCQGWKELGVPTRVLRDDKRELRLTDIICEVLRHRSHVYVSTSLG